MGEIGGVLEKVLVRAVGKLLAENPAFRKYEWEILACVIGLPVIWMVFAESEILWAALTEFRDYLKEPRQIRPTNEDPSESGLVSRKDGHALKQTFHGAAISAPKGLRIPLGMAVLLLVIAIFADMPYDFFVILRVMVFVTCVACITTLRKVGAAAASWVWIIVAVAVFYNPLAPIRLHRETWTWINIATIPVFCLFGLSIAPGQETP